MGGTCSLTRTNVTSADPGYIVYGARNEAHKSLQLQVSPKVCQTIINGTLKLANIFTI